MSEIKVPEVLLMVSDDFEVLSYEVPSVEFSDHHPVFVRLKYNSQRQ